MFENLINVADFERVAGEKLDAGVAGYFFGGANDEVTLGENVAAWRGWRLRPRVLAGHGEWSTRVELLGAELSMPILVAPVAYQRLVDEEGELADGARRCGGGDGDVPLDPGDVEAGRGCCRGAQRAPLVPALLLPR